jgi:predicted transcriptional regulator
MNLQQIAEATGLKVLSGETQLQRKCTGGYCSDLLSDVMGRAGAGKLWITLQTHKNVIAIASLKELAGVIIVNGLHPDPDMLEQAKTEEIPVFSSEDGAFEICGKLYPLINQE